MTLLSTLVALNLSVSLCTLYVVLRSKGTNMDIATLTEAVTRNTSVVSSAKLLIAGMAAKITAAGTDQAKLDALVAELRASDDDLAAAVAANTPAETAPPVAAPETPAP